MKLYYWKGHVSNFGDELNVWLWPRLLPGVLDNDPRAIFVGIGSLLNRQLPVAPLKVIFGAGTGYGAPPTLDKRSWKIYCVRGPLTAKKLNVSENLAITDSATLVRCVSLPVSDVTYSVSWMPHWISAEVGEWQAVCREMGINFIDPRDKVENVLAAIGSTKLLVTGALHGAIIADALRVPWIAVQTKPFTLEFKWVDWSNSVGLDYRPVHLPLTGRAELLFSKYYKFRNYLDTTVRRVIANLTSGQNNIDEDRHQRILQSHHHFDGPSFGKRVIHSADRAILKRIIPSVSTILIPPAAQTRYLEQAKLSLEEACRREPKLSSDQTISSVTARLEEKLGAFKLDIAKGLFERV